MAASEPLIAGAIITRVDRPLSGVYAFSLSWREGAGCLCFAAGADRAAPRVALLDARPRGEPADGEVRGLREKLESGRVRGLLLGADGAARVLLVARGDHLFRATFSVRGVSVSCARDEALPASLWTGMGTGTGVTSDFAVTDAARFLAEHEAATLALIRAEALRAVERARIRLARRRAAIATDVAALGEAEDRASHAQRFVAVARAATPGARELVTTDWSSGESVERRFPLLGDRPAHAELEAVFQHAKRLRRGLAQTEARSREAVAANDLLADAAIRLGAAPDRATVSREIERLQKTLPGDVRLEQLRPGSSPRKSLEAPPRKGYRTFVSVTGAPLLVGKGGADNDELTLRVARPHDHFFHAKDATGAHVIAVAPNRSAPLDARVLVEGALLAAHFSDRRGAPVVDVHHCERRHLRKRKGAAPGSVELLQEKVIAVRIDPAILTRLLSTEGRG